MIITKNWLNEWIDLSDVSTDTILKTLNSIGLEVDSYQKISIPDGVVVGYVEQCERHPDADKLNVCQVNVGTDIRQIVCGASNVREGIYIALATVGSELPGNLKIKEAKLRGIESYGMICSSKEIGLPAMGEGIMILDVSIGELVLGKNLNTYSVFNDEIIEIELTANRGDCLSIRGVARDLRAALSRSLNVISRKEKGDIRVGIGRILQLNHGSIKNLDLLFGAVEVNELFVPLSIRVRLSMIDESFGTSMEAFLKYATHSTGVILRAYPFENIKGAEKGILTLREDENGYSALYGNDKISIIGVSQDENSYFNETSKIAIIEASYINPNILTQMMGDHKIPSCPLYYRTSRGSEPDIRLGIQYIMDLFEHYSNSTVYGGHIELLSDYEPSIVNMCETDFESFIGYKIDRTRITNIFKNLEMDSGKTTGDTISISIPKFRHDIINKQDVVEEIVRIYGIDNIPSKPLVFSEQNRYGADWTDYQKNRMYRQRAAQSGFYESVHFIFNERSQIEEYGFKSLQSDKDLVNPITATLDTLRPTLLVGLLNSASANMKVSQKRVSLFESGTVFTSERYESKKIGFITSGPFTNEKISNSGKPSMVGFSDFVQSISTVVGDIDLKNQVLEHKLSHPYVSAYIYQNNQKIGEIFQLHPTYQDALDLPITFLCEIDFDALSFGLIEAKSYSKFQASFRDLSIVISKETPYVDVRNVIEKLSVKFLQRFYPVDRYVSEALGDKMSLTLRFVLQSDTKTLEEEDIASAMDTIVNSLREELGVNLR